jgi:hypothetical protein
MLAKTKNPLNKRKDKTKDNLNFLGIPKGKKGNKSKK